MKIRNDVREKILEMSSNGMSHRKILAALGLPDKYRGYMTPILRGETVAVDRQDEFAEALGLEPTLRRRFYRPTLARQWKPLLEALDMSVEDVMVDWVNKNRPQLWYLVPTEEEKGT